MIWRILLLTLFGGLFIYFNSGLTFLCLCLVIILLSLIKGVYLPKILDLFLVLLAVVVLFIENYHYPNYVYSAIHILPDRLAIFAGLVIGIHHFSSRIMLIFIFAFTLTSVLSATTSIAVKSIVWFQSPQTYSRSFVTQHYGRITDYVDFISRSTSETSTILIPDYKPGKRFTSDYWVMQSLLFPRKIVQYQPGMDFRNINYILVTSETDAEHQNSPVWPDFCIANTTFLPFVWSKNDYSWGLLIK